MKRYLLILLFISGLMACNDENRGGEKDPSVTHPPSEAIPDSMQLVNDSVIVPDTTPR